MRLPVMQCDDGCGACCTLVPVTERELEAVRQYAAANGITPVSQGATCPFFQQGRCQVYEVRPKICRAFGHDEKLVCPRGYNRNAKPKAIRQWLTRELPTRMLHEVLTEVGGARV